MKCKAITWVSTLNGTIGIGVFEDNFGEVTIRAAIIEGFSIEVDKAHVGSWGGRIPVEELELLLAAAKGEV